MNKSSSVNSWLSSKLLSSNNDKVDDREFDGGLVKIRDRTLIVGNSIYQISNISTIEVVDLSTEEDVSTPSIVITLIIIGLLAIAFAILGGFAGLSADAAILAFAMGIIFIVLAVVINSRREKKRINFAFALNVLMNSGDTTAIHSDDADILKRMMLTLLNVMNNKQIGQQYNFNLDQRQVYDMNGAVFASGDVSGDIVNIVN